MPTKFRKNIWVKRGTFFYSCVILCQSFYLLRYLLIFIWQLYIWNYWLLHHQIRKKKDNIYSWFENTLENWLMSVMSFFLWFFLFSNNSQFLSHVKLHVWFLLMVKINEWSTQVMCSHCWIFCSKSSKFHCQLSCNSVRHHQSYLCFSHHTSFLTPQEIMLWLNQSKKEIKSKAKLSTFYLQSKSNIWKMRTYGECTKCLM